MVFSTSSAFENPALFRRAILDLPITYSEGPVYKGAHFYIQLTGICDVACSHCMYSSDQSQRHSGPMRLDDADVELALRYVAESSPNKISISGGGEPFLELKHLLRIVEAAQCQYIELITAANWARSQDSAKSILLKISDAARSNPRSPEVMIRASIDLFHLTAPNPVPLQAYVNLTHAWIEHGDSLQLGFRGLLLEGDRSVDLLADALGGILEPQDSWNKVIRLSNDVILPVTLNVLRFSGKGEQYRSEMAHRTMALRQYFAAFEEAPNRLLLGRAINDAIKRTYYSVGGISITLDFDGSLYIFTATAPDRRCNIRTHTFRESVDWFYRDPITRVLMAEGPYWLCEVVRDIDNSLADRAIQANDVCSMVDTLLSDEVGRAFATAVALKTLLSRGEVTGFEQVRLVAAINELPMAALKESAIEAFKKKT
jgi:hypothetical protein